MARVRLDTLLVARGLAASRERARALVMAGSVRVAGIDHPKPGQLVAEDASVDLAEPDHPWVGRGALKLLHALDRFGIDPTGRVALDIGASTGGFTQVLLARGAAHVIALDVGRNQLDWRIRNDRRVTALEGVNARTLVASMLPEEYRAVSLVVIDVSFISLTLILPVVPPLLLPHADVVALVKPQFEAGRDEVRKGGLVTDPAVHARVLDEIAAAAAGLGFRVHGSEPSPITGATGNREFFLHLVSEDPRDAA
ncbi:MAG: TlyA family RNA methyltransferase [Vicinamibacteraceae bacterium]|nr:TlyA family RNA methyltransferase [Vicinamibacteraceae bacterium]